MEKVTIPKGTICIHAFPTSRQRDSYMACCDDYSVIVFIEAPRELSPYLQRAVETSRVRYDINRNIYTPCVIDKKVHEGLSHHKGWLLSPPGVNTKSELFVPGLLIPDLRVQSVIKREGRLIEYILVSDYADNQQFFGPPKPDLDERLETKYQGLVIGIPQDKRKRPVVRIKLDSSENEKVFKDNSETLEDITTSNLKFWWKI